MGARHASSLRHLKFFIVFHARSRMADNVDGGWLYAGSRCGQGHNHIVDCSTKILKLISQAFDWRRVQSYQLYVTP